MELMLTNRKRCDFPFNLPLSPEDMPLSVVSKAIDLASDDRNQPLLLIGNEPALYPDLDKVISLAAKNNVALAIETSGLMPDSAKTLICKSNIIVSLRIYQPKYYTEETLKEVKANLSAFIEAKNNLQFVLICNEPDADYSFIIDWIKEFHIEGLVIRGDCTLPIDSMMNFYKNTTKIAVDVTLHGGTAIFDCSPQPCGFDDASFGVLAKVGIKRATCTPHLAVMPNGLMSHCRAMTIVPGPNVSSFKNQKDLMEFYYDVFRHMQLSVPSGSPCENCITRRVKICTGPNMAAKAKVLLSEREELKPLLADPENTESEEHYNNAWKMAAASIKLGMHEDVVECLEEMRRLKPENPDCHFWLACSYWELGRRDDAEDEFRKCSRLSEDHVPALWELHRRLVKNGNSIRARMLLEEIKKLSAAKK